MPAGLRVALLSVVFCGAAAARPVTVEESGTFGFSWVDDDGTTITTEETITVA